MAASRRLLRLAFLFVPAVLTGQDGFLPVIGGLPFDSGLALGVEYRKSRLAAGVMDARAKAVGSTKKYELLEAAFDLPRLAGGKLFAGVSARYRNFPEEDFWGLGPKSRRDRRTTFRMEDFDSTATLGVRPFPWLESGLRAGFLRANTGPGKDRDRPSIEEWFTEAEAPALHRQPHYLHGGAFIRVNYQDHPDDPREGGFYQFDWTSYADRDSGGFNFQRYQLDLRQFAPSFQRDSTAAARLLLIFSSKEAGRQVPFFLQPTLGGGNDLRGYLQYRFRDENMMVFNLEHRWRATDMFHAVAFADAGRVFGRPTQLGLSGIRGSAGAGGRVKLGERFLLGADLGWGPDGIRLWFRGSHAF